MQNRLRVLGSGTPLSSYHHDFDFRNPSGYLVQINGKKILLDCGEGIRRKMDEMHFDYFNIDEIFISHFHPDHFSLDTFVQAVYVRAKKEKSIKKLTIYGPPLIKQIFINIWNMKNIPSYEDTFPHVVDINFIEYKNNEKSIKDCFCITPFKVKHGGMIAYALRFEWEQKIFVYSGDCSYSEEILDAAKNADVFLCESGNDIGEEKMKNLNHLTPYQTGLIAKSSHVMHLIVTHYSGKDSNESIISEIKRAGFNRNISIASDLDSFKI